MEGWAHAEALEFTAERTPIAADQDGNTPFRQGTAEGYPWGGRGLIAALALDAIAAHPIDEAVGCHFDADVVGVIYLVVDDETGAEAAFALWVYPSSRGLRGTDARQRILRERASSEGTTAGSAV